MPEIVILYLHRYFIFPLLMYIWDSKLGAGMQTLLGSDSAFLDKFSVPADLQWWETKGLNLHAAFFPVSLVCWGRVSGKRVPLVMDVKSTIFSYNKPLAPCSPRVTPVMTGCLPSMTKRLARGVWRAGSNGSSLSIHWAEQPERFTALCIFSLMNSLLSLLSVLLPLSEKTFP